MTTRETMALEIYKQFLVSQFAVDYVKTAVPGESKSLVELAVFTADILLAELEKSR